MAGLGVAPVMPRCAARYRRAPAQTAVLVKQLRQALEGLLEEKVRRPGVRLEELGGQVSKPRASSAGPWATTWANCVAPVGRQLGLLIVASWGTQVWCGRRGVWEVAATSSGCHAHEASCATPPLALPWLQLIQSIVDLLSHEEAAQQWSK